MKNQCQNRRFFDGSEPRLALYSSLISHFCHFRKNRKNRCQKGSQKSLFLVQKPTLGAPGAIDSTIFDNFWWWAKRIRVIYVLGHSLELAPWLPHLWRPTDCYLLNFYVWRNFIRKVLKGGKITQLWAGGDLSEFRDYIIISHLGDLFFHL